MSNPTKCPNCSFPLTNATEEEPVRERELANAYVVIADLRAKLEEIQAKLAADLAREDAEAEAHEISRLAVAREIDAAEVEATAGVGNAMPDAMPEAPSTWPVGEGFDRPR